MGYNAATRTFDTIADLRGQRGTSNATVNVSGYYAPGDHGGVKYWWDAASGGVDDGCFIIKPTVGNPSDNGRWRLNYNGVVDVKWGGAKGDGIQNDTPFIQGIIDNFVVVGVTDNGVAVEFTRGHYLLNGLIVKTGCTLFANQMAKDNFISNVPVTISSYGNPDYIIDTEDADTSNFYIKNLYIDCDSDNQPQLIAGVRLKGHKCYFIGNNINRAHNVAVWNDCGLVYIEKNGIYGWYGNTLPAFTGINDFRGALHCPAIGDSYIYDNEIGAGLNYFTSTVNPRDSVNGRIVALSLGAVFGGTSVISGNLFENGDRAVAIGNSLYCNFHNNRYELSAMGGLYIFGPMQFATFSQERFADNSLSVDGAADDITIAIGAAGNIAFIAPTFESLFNISIPNSSFKVNYHISNYGSDLVDLVTPVIDDSYSLNGLVNLSGPTLLPVRQVKGQYDPDNPQYHSVSVRKLPAETPQVGFTKLKRGTDIDTQSLMGAIEFWYVQQDPLQDPGITEDKLGYTIGFSPKEYLSINAQQPGGGIFAFGGGDMQIARDGAQKLTIWSLDSGGPVQMLLQAGALVDSQASFTLDPVTEDLTITTSNDIILGLNENLVLKQNGLNFIPFTPTVSDILDTFLLGRDTATGEIVILDPADTIPGPANFIENQDGAAQNGAFYINQPSKIEYLTDVTGNDFAALEVYRTIENSLAKAPQGIRSVFRAFCTEAGHEDKEFTSLYGGLHITAANNQSYTNATEGLIAVAGTASTLGGSGNITLMSCFGALGGNAPTGTMITSRFAFFKVTSYDQNSNTGKVTSIAGFAQPKLSVPGASGAIQWFSGMGDVTTSGGMLGNQTWPTGNWNMYDASGYANYLSGTVLIATLTDDTTSKLQVAGTTRTNKVVGGMAIGDTLSLQNYTAGTTGAVLDQYGLTVGGGTASLFTLFKATRAFTNPTGNVHGFRAEQSAIQNSAPTATSIFGGFFVPTIAAGNNQNWTSGTAMQGISVAPTIASGATGTIGGVVAGTFDLNLRAAGVTVTNAIGVRIYVDPLATSTLTNLALLTIGVEGLISGNWGIYNSVSSNNYLGTGNTLINTTTDSGTGAKLQVNGAIEVGRTTLSGSIHLPIITVTANTTLNATHHTVIVNNTGTVTMTLPAAATCSGRMYIIKKISAALNNVIIQGNGAELIDANNTLTIATQYSGVNIQSNGTSWYVLSVFIGGSIL